MRREELHDLSDKLRAIIVRIVADKIVRRALALAMTDAQGNREIIAEIVREEYEASPLVMFKPLDDFLLANFTAIVFWQAKQPDAQEVLKKITEEQAEKMGKII